jgi:hypothetical protein
MLWERFFSNSEGQNSDTSPLMLKNHALLMQNHVYDESGSISVRQGTEPLKNEPLWDTAGTTAQRIRGLFVYTKSGGTSYIIAFAGTRAYTYDSDADEWTSQQTGLTESTVYSATIFDDVFYCANGNNDVQTFDGTTWGDTSGVSNFPSAPSYVAAHRNHLFAFPVNTNHLRFSPLNWNGTDAWVTLDDLAFGDDETALLTGGSQLGREFIVTTRNKHFKITGSSKANWSIIPMPSAHGCVSHNSIQRIGDKLMWLSEAGFIVFDGHSAQIISNKTISRYWRGIDASRLNVSVSAYYRGNKIKRNWYICFLTLEDDVESYDYNNFAFLYDITNNSWQTITGWYGDCTAVGEDSNGFDVLYFGTKDGIVQEADKFNAFDDSGAPIDKDLILGPATGGNIPLETKKNFRRILMWYGSRNTATLKVMLTANYEDLTDSSGDTVAPVFRNITLESFDVPEMLNGVRYDQPNIWESQQMRQLEFGVNKAGRTLYLRFSNSEMGKNYIIHGFSVGCIPRGEYVES